AFKMDPALLSARRLVNLDAELEGRIYLSCAGGRELHATWELDRDAHHHGDVPVRLWVEGLNGGHSGVDIQEGRANATTLLVQVLTDKEIDLEGVRLASCVGGGRPNAIPRNAETILWCARTRVPALARAVEQAGVRIAQSFADVDPELVIGF